MRALLLIAVVLLLPACASVADLRPGTGRTVTVSGVPYDRVWESAARVAKKHFEVVEQDQMKGVIRAELNIGWNFWGEYVGIFVRPPAPGAEVYTIEVVNRKRMVIPLTGQDWEGQILRDVVADITGAWPP